MPIRDDVSLGVDDYSGSQRALTNGAITRAGRPLPAGATEEMIEKIAMGKLNAFFKENTLTAQPFVKDPSKTVAEHLKSVDSGLKVIQFKRVQLG